MKASELTKRLKDEYSTLVGKWLQLSKLELVELAYEMYVISTAKAYIEFACDYEEANLKAYENSEAILEDYYEFHLGAEDNTISDYTIDEFEDYLLSK